MNDRPTSKLDFQWIEPFKISKCLKNDNYQLDLPNKRRYNSFHVSKLRLAPEGLPSSTDQIEDDFSRGRKKINPSQSMIKKNNLWNLKLDETRKTLLI